MIYRLQHHYNLGKKINSINAQAKKTHTSFSEERKARGLKPVELKGDTKPGSHVLGTYQAQIESNIQERLNLERAKKGPARVPSDACRPYIKLKSAFMSTLLGKNVENLKL